MINSILLIIGSSSAIIWGIAHLLPTKAVVHGFGDISSDNRNIIKMEWMTEGFSLIFVGTLVLSLAIFTDHSIIIIKFVYLISALFLISLAILSLFTGFKVNFLPYKLCPVIFSASGIMIILGSLL